MRWWRGGCVAAAAVAVGLALGLVPVTGAAAEKPAPGAAGGSDPVFPDYGDGGYLARHYGIDVTYRPGDGRLDGITTISAVSTQALSRFDLDLVLHATSVTVDGRPARFRQYTIASDTEHGGKLEVTPSRPVPRGAAMTVVVRYSDVPADRTVGGLDPWEATPSGAIVEGAPESAAWWFPSNDQLADKASYDVALTAPAILVGVSDGSLISTRTSGGWTTRRWRETAPIATYQQFAAFGDYRISYDRSATGIPLTFAIVANPGPGAEAAEQAIAGTGEVLDWLTRTWGGPYPLPSGGAVLTDRPYTGLETATHPLLSADDFLGTIDPYPHWNALVHENAHQYFGDDLTPANWGAWWLSEGFAVFNEWLYAEQHGQGSAAEAFVQEWTKLPATSPIWDNPIGQITGYAGWANASAYFRGALALQALRVRLGDATFYRVVGAWVAGHRHGTVTTPEFTALAQQVSGQDLTGFFRAWLDTPRRPDPTAANGFPPALR